MPIFADSAVVCPCVTKRKRNQSPGFSPVGVERAIGSPEAFDTATTAGTRATIAAVARRRSRFIRIRFTDGSDSTIARSLAITPHRQSSHRPRKTLTRSGDFATESSDSPTRSAPMPKQFSTRADPLGVRAEPVHSLPHLTLFFFLLLSIYGLPLAAPSLCPIGAHHSARIFTPGFWPIVADGSMVASVTDRASQRPKGVTDQGVFPSQRRPQSQHPDRRRLVVPMAVTAGDKIESLRQWASVRCLSADQAGMYSRTEGVGGEC